jgi:flagellar motor switch protein FliG
MEVTELTKTQKAAIVMLALGKERAAKLFKNLDDNEIDKITMAIAEITMVEPKTKEEVLKEFYQEVVAAKGGVMGGDASVKELLETILGKAEATDYLQRMNLGRKGDADIFNILKSVDMGQLSNFLHSEQPQTIALILSHLDPAQAAQVLSGLSVEQQSEVMIRMATMSQTDPEIVAQVGAVVKKQLSSSIGQQHLKSAGGAKNVAEILNLVDRTTERNILSAIEKQNQELSEEVKKMMFVFEDIVLVENRSIQRVLKEIDTSELALALKSASEEVKTKVFSNVSKRAAELIQEEIEFMGPVRLRDVEEAQQRIVNVVRRLEEEGEVVIVGRGGAGEKFV